MAIVGAETDLDTGELRSLYRCLNRASCPPPDIHRLLVYSTVTGKAGLGAFLGEEKGSNPFYKVTNGWWS